MRARLKFGEQAVKLNQPAGEGGGGFGGANYGDGKMCVCVCFFSPLLFDKVILFSLSLLLSWLHNFSESIQVCDHGVVEFRSVFVNCNYSITIIIVTDGSTFWRGEGRFVEGSGCEIALFIRWALGISGRACVCVCISDVFEKFPPSSRHRLRCDVISGWWWLPVQVDSKSNSAPRRWLITIKLEGQKQEYLMKIDTNVD